MVGYIRVSTGKQAQRGLSLAAQRQRILDEAKHRGWQIVAVYKDAGISGKKMANQPQLQLALAAVRSHTADGVVVAALDRISRSMADFAGLLAQSVKQGWSLIALDIGIDTTTPAGRFVAHTMAALAQWEREVIGQRTKEALAEMQQNGTQLGRPVVMSADVQQRIMTLRRRRYSYYRIAQRLTRDGVPTAHGAKAWRYDVVQATVQRMRKRA